MTQFLSIALSALLLVSSSGISINKHYCHGHLQEISLGILPPDCCCQNIPMADGCCDDETELYQLDSEYTPVSTHDLEPDFSALLPTMIHIWVEKIEVQQAKYLNYKPPLLFQDIPIVVQSFLI